MDNYRLNRWSISNWNSSVTDEWLGTFLVMTARHYFGVGGLLNGLWTSVSWLNTNAMKIIAHNQGSLRRLLSRWSIELFKWRIFLIHLKNVMVPIQFKNWFLTLLVVISNVWKKITTWKYFFTGPSVNMCLRISFVLLNKSTIVN